LPGEQRGIERAPAAINLEIAANAPAEVAERAVKCGFVELHLLVAFKTRRQLADPANARRILRPRRER
jgi:hypothetical protein